MEKREKLFYFLSQSPKVQNPASAYFFGEFHEDLEWQDKTDSEKIAFRLTLARISEKVGKGEDLYGLGLVEVHKLVLKIISHIDTQLEIELPLEEQDITLLCLKGVLLIEKAYLDQYYKPFRHLPKDFMKMIFLSTQENIIDVSLSELLEDLDREYEKMYDNWKKK
jgi:hypothetical protein